jgi:GntR family transcriptional regulator
MAPISVEPLAFGGSRTLPSARDDEIEMRPRVESKNKTSKSLNEKRRAGDGSFEPLYVQVAHLLRQEIEKGVYPFGSQFPIEEELCTRFAVSRHTVREAMRKLRDEGFLSSRQGVRSIVVPPPPSDPHFLNPLSINELAAYTENSHYAIDSIKMTAVDRRLASQMEVPVGEEWLRLTGIRYAKEEDTPICWTEVCINREFAAVGRLLQRHRGPIFPLIEDLFTKKIVEVHQKIGATVISASLAAGLKAKEGSTALEIRRWYKMADDKVAQFTISTHPSPRFCFSQTMKRGKG